MLSVRFVAVNNFEMEKTSCTKEVHSARARTHKLCTASAQKAEGQRRRLFCAECVEGPAGNRPEDHCSAQNAPRDSRRCAMDRSKVEQTSSRLFCAECTEGPTEIRPEDSSAQNTLSDPRRCTRDWSQGEQIRKTSVLNRMCRGTHGEQTRRSLFCTLQDRTERKGQKAWLW